MDMASETGNSFKEGYLFLPPHGVLGQLKKSWGKKYCQLFKASKHGIERLEVYESEEEASKTLTVPIITLENCIKITQDAQKTQPHLFVVVTKTNVYHFAANSEEDMLSWIASFQSVAFKDNASRQTIEEDNDLYCTSGDPGVFSVKLVASEVSGRCGLTPGSYTLVVTPAALQLRDASTEQCLLYTWPYRYIRRYGCHSGKFTFEAGRKCDSGEGTFHLEHSNQQEIFRCISSKMKSMKKLLTGEVPALLCGDTQFQAALGMMARSRSPLPPSPTNTTILDAELCTISSAKSLIPLPEIISSDLLPAPPLKPKPRKPPRKNLPAIKDSQLCREDGSRRSDLDQGIPNYDDVEFRNEAWRTLGVGVMTHTERPFSLAGTQDNGTHVNGVKAFTQTPSNNFYDRLQHWGSVSKVNPAYRQINAMATVTSAPLNNWIPNVEQASAMTVARLADDSHQGYGMIRKKSVPSDELAFGPHHQVHNDLEYAVVCKPNRV